MKRLSGDEVERICDYVKLGHSLNKISKKLDISKTTIYYHYIRIKPKRETKPFNLSDEEKVGEVVGIFAGDGSLTTDKNYHYIVRIHLGTYMEDYADYVRNLYEDIFNKRFRKYIDRSRITLITQSKDIYNFFFNYLNF